MNHNYTSKEGPRSCDFKFEGSDARRIVIKGYADGTVRLKIYQNEDDLLIQAILSNQAAIEFGNEVSWIARDNE